MKRYRKGGQHSKTSVYLHRTQALLLCMFMMISLLSGSLSFAASTSAAEEETEILTEEETEALTEEETEILTEEETETLTEEEIEVLAEDEDSVPVDAGVASIDGEKFETLQDAINAVEDGQTIVLLADITENVTSSDKSYTLEMNDQTIDGGKTTTVYTIAGGNVTLQNGAITNGYTSNAFAYGTAIKVTGDATLTMDQVHVYNNIGNGRGTIYASSAKEINIIDSVIENNSCGAQSQGGALYAEKTPNISITGSTIQGNTGGSSAGAGLYISNSAISSSTLTIEGTHFIENKLSSVYASDGNAIHFTAKDADVSITNTDFTGNQYGKTIYVTGVSSGRFEQVTVAENSGNRGQSVPTVDINMNSGSTCNMMELILDDNTDVSNALALGGSNTTYTLTDCLVTFNTVSESTVYASDSDMKVAFTNTVVRDNTSSDTGKTATGGIYVGSSTTFTMDADKPGAVYHNNCDASVDTYIDWYIANGAKVTIPKASAMQDDAETGAGYFQRWEYIWKGLDDVSDLSDGMTPGTTVPGRYYAGTDIVRDVAQIGDDPGENKENIRATLREAIEDAGDDQDIYLIVGDYDHIGNSHAAEPLTIDKSVTINIHGKTLSCKDKKAEVFTIVENGNLTLEGGGLINSNIHVSGGNLCLNGSMRMGTIILDDGQFITVGKQFSTKGLTFALSDDLTKEFNSVPDPETSKEVVLIKGCTDTDLIPLLSVAGITSPWVSIEVMGDDIVLRRTTLPEGIYVGQSGSDSNDGKTYYNAVRTVEKAIDIANEGDTIYMIDTITVDKSETWNGDKKKLTIKRFSLNENVGTAPMIMVSGSLTIKNITIDGCSEIYSNCGSVITVLSGGNLTIAEGATLQNNDVSKSGTSLYDRSGGAVFTSGAVTMTGGDIKNCTAGYGGGVYCYRGASSFTMEGGTISGNKAIYGGGISLGFDTSSVIYSPDPDKFQFIMNGGKVTDNEASSNGGGLFVQSTFKAVITKGEFTYNKCGSGNYGGGAIYVNGGKSVDGVKIADGELWLTNVLLTENSAGLYGGGFAGCGTSSTVVRITDGSAIYNNTVNDNKNDIFVGVDPEIITAAGLKSSDPDVLQDHIAQYMLDGTPYQWKKVSDGKYATDDEMNNNSGKNVYTDAVPSNPDSDDFKVIIKYNTADYTGGGIGSNGQVYIGAEYEVPEDYTPNSKFEVAKVWDGLSEEDEAQKFPLELEQLYIWVLSETDDGAHYVTYDTLVGSFYEQKYWKEKVTFTKLSANSEADTNNYIVVEEAVFSDGRHIWSANGKDYEDTINGIRTEFHMDTGDILWSDSDDSPYQYEIDVTVDEATEEGELDQYLLTFHNTLQYGTLTVTKMVTGSEGETDREFSFEVTIGDETFNITLKHGESWTSEKFLVGTAYTVKEKEANQDGYTTTAENESGTITLGDTAQATFINTRDGEPQGEKPDKPSGDSDNKPSSGSDNKPSSGSDNKPSGDSDKTDGEPSGGSDDTDNYPSGESDDTPDKPSEDSNKTDNLTNEPRTGDNSYIDIWISLMLASLIGLFVCLISKRVSKYSKTAR